MQQGGATKLRTLIGASSVSSASVIPETIRQLISKVTLSIEFNDEERECLLRALEWCVRNKRQIT
jgi:hypothetical protein